MAPQTTRPVDADDADGTETRTLRLRRLLSPLQALSGVVLLVGAARAASSDRRRAWLLALAGGGLLASWVRRQGPPTPNDPEAPTQFGAETAGDDEDSGEPEVVDDDDDASDVVEADDDVPAPDVDETDDRM